MRAAVLGAAALLLAACGGDDSGDPAAGATSSVPAEATVASTAPGAADPAPSAGCGTTTVVPGESEQTVASGGDDRAYHQRVPPAHDGETPVPLVVDFHGYSEGGPIHVLHTELGAYGDEQGFVTVTPDSGYPVPRWDTGEGSRDLVMVGDLLDQLEADLCLDTDRLYVTGLSNGAFMTSAVACAHSDRVAAVAPVAGIVDPEWCTTERPVPVVAFHGTDDTFVAFDGGLGSSVADLPQADGSGTLDETGAEEAQGPSIPEVTAAWAERNGCEAEPAEQEVAGDVRLLDFPCPDGAATRLYVVDGGGHTWPGSEFDLSIADIVGPVTMAIDANEVMWAFFEEHPLPG